MQGVFQHAAGALTEAGQIHATPRPFWLGGGERPSATGTTTAAAVARGADPIVMPDPPPRTDAQRAANNLVRRSVELRFPGTAA